MLNFDSNKSFPIWSRVLFTLFLFSENFNVELLVSFWREFLWLFTELNLTFSTSYRVNIDVY
jgi:hypothetical protein